MTVLNMRWIHLYILKIHAGLSRLEPPPSEETALLKSTISLVLTPLSLRQILFEGRS